MTPSFFREIRSVTVLYEPSAETEPLDVGRLVAWLQEYDQAFKAGIGITRGEGLHLLYGRTLNILGPSLLDHVAPVLLLTQAARACGMSVGIHLFVDECLDRPEELQALLEEQLVSSLFLDFSELRDDAAQNASVLPLIEQFIHRGLSLTMLAEVGVLRRLGALDSPAVNQSNFQIIPARERDAPLAPFVTADKPAGKVIPITPVGAHEERLFDPCATRMQLFVDADGHVYPCQGLVGLRQVALCRIEESFALDGVATDIATTALSSLIARGPDLPASALYQAAGSTCDRHRAQVSSQLAH